MEENSLHWGTVEYHHREKTADWYWAVGIIAVSIAVTSVILGNLVFAILIILSAFTLAMFASRKPEIIEIEINEKGITAGNLRYPFSAIDEFWVEHENVRPKILFKLKKKFAPLGVVLISDIEPETVRNFLGQYAIEHELHEPLTQIIFEYLGF